MKLRSQQQQWNRLAASDPFWAILTDPRKAHGGWDPADFFATGRTEIADAIRIAESLGLPAKRTTALDFGCGAGRLTQALSEWFDSVTGVDISPGMLDLARRHNQAACTFLLNTRDDLAQLSSESFDFVYSRIVLQHLPPRHSRRYIHEFVRVLAPGGLALFQVPSRMKTPLRYRLANQANQFVRRRLLSDPRVMEMYGVPPHIVERDIQDAGGRLLDTRPDESAGPGWESFFYAASK